VDPERCGWAPEQFGILRHDRLLRCIPSVGGWIVAGCSGMDRASFLGLVGW